MAQEQNRGCRSADGASAQASPARLEHSFFARPALEVAPDLLGCRLVYQLGPRCRLEGVIVEVEAYLGDGSDPASHAHAGPTRRCAAMFGPPGRFYVYRSMGLHFCVNLVCEPEGRGAAVLLRAVEPRRGLEVMVQRRGGRGGRELASGPGKLAQAFGIGAQHNGDDALAGPLRVEAAHERPARIVAGPRVGIRKAADKPWRFCVADNPHLSRTPLNRHTRPFCRS